MSRLLDFLIFAGATGALLFLMIIVGYGVARHLLRLRVASAVATSLPAGLLVLVVIGGGGAIAYGGPLGTIVPLAVGATAVVGLVTVVRDGRQSTLRARASWGAPAITIAGASALYAWEMRAIFGYGPLATVSWNNDVLSYAYAARHLAELGSGAPGWIIGYDAGRSARGDVVGAYAVFIGSGVTLDDALRWTLPIMCVAVAAVAAAACALVHQILPRHAPIAVLAGLTTVVGLPATYDAYQYFLSEKIAIAIAMVSIVGLIAVRGLVRAAVWQAVVVIALVLAYPQAAPLQIGAAVVVALTMPWRFGRGRLRPTLVRLVSVLGGTALGLAVLGPYLLDRIERARFLLRVAAGWPMPTLSLMETIGLPGLAVPLGKPTLLVAEIGIIVIVAGGLLLARRRERTCLALALALLLPFGLFIRFAFAEPDSYRQWKAMAYSAPFLIVAVGIVAFVLLRVASERLRPIRHAHRVRALAMASTALFGVWFVLALRGSFDTTSSIRDCDWPSCPVGSDVRERLHRYAATAGEGPVAVNLGPFWPSMTAAYYLWGRPIAMRDPNYWAVSDAPVDKTLTDRGWQVSK